MDLTKLTDRELFEISFNISTEISNRIIKIFKKLNITIYFFNSSTEVFARVNKNLYESNEHEEFVNIIAIGYFKSKEQEDVYLIGEDNSVYYGDLLADNLWDVYKEFRDENERDLQVIGT